MKWVPVILLVLFGIDPKLIGKINSAKTEAKKAFLANDYTTAISRYRYLTDSLGVNEDEILINLAHSYFNLNDTANAVASYQKLLTSANKKIKSNAYQQLGVINNRKGQLEEALGNFKEAIKTDLTNEDARYDYEMVKKKLEEKKKQEEQKKKDQNKDNKDEQQKDNKDQQNKDKQNQDKKDQEQQKKEQQEKDQQKKEQQQKEQSEKEKEEKEKKEAEQKEQQEKEKKDEPKKEKNFNPDKMKEMKVSEEKAKMILEAMKNQEKQYLQQNKRKAEKPRDKGKPDW